MTDFSSYPLRSYIPIQSDYSDLADVAAFFIGAPDGTGSHDALAKRIAQQGKQWSEQHYREVDMAAYAFRLRASSRPLLRALCLLSDARTPRPARTSLLLLALAVLEYARLLHRDDNDLHSMDYKL